MKLHPRQMTEDVKGTAKPQQKILEIFACFG